MRLPLLLLALLLASSSAQGYDKWHYSGDTFVEGDEIYLVEHYDFKSPYVVLKLGSDEMVIREEACKRVEVMEYCVLAIDRNLSNTRVKFAGGDAYAAIHLTIKELGTDIKIAKSFTKTNPGLDEQVSATVTIKNTGRFATDSFLYTETLPGNVRASSATSGLRIDGKTLTYKLNIPAESEVSLVYNFKVSNYTSFVSKGVATITQQGYQLNLSSPSVTITPQKPYSFSAKLSATSLEAREEAELTITLKATERVEFKQVELIAPRGVSLQSDLTGKERYAWSGEVSTGETKELKTKIRPLSAGDYVFASRASVADSKGNLFYEEQNLTLKATLSNIGSTLSVKESTLSEGSGFRLAFSLNNPNEVLFYRNINVTITSKALSPISAGLDLLAPKEAKTLIVKEDLIAPGVEDQESFDIVAFGTYETSEGSRFNFTKSATLTVLPLDELITISHVIGAGALDPGNETLVTVKVKTSSKENLEVQAHEEIEGGFEMGGKTQGVLYFTGPGELVAYTYTLKVPEDARSDVKIKSYATVVGKTSVATKESFVDVNYVEAIAEKSDEVAQAKAQSEQAQEGAFDRAIHAVVGFFQKLFG